MTNLESENIFIMKKLLIFFAFISVSSLLFAQNGLNFDGVNDVVTTNYVGITGNNPRTIEAWVKTTANTGTGGVQGVLVDWGQMTPNGSRSTFNISTGNALRFEVGGSGVSGVTLLNDGVWHHVTAVYDPLAIPNTKLYVDGVLDVSGNITIPVNTLQGVNVKLGERCDGINRFNGAMDEVRIWNVALTATQIQDNMNSELCSITNSALKLYLPFNQGTANGANATISSVTDLSPTNAIGTLANFALTGTNSNWVAGKTLSQGYNLSSVTVNSCGSYTWPLTGMTYTSSGFFNTIIANQQGCDTIVTLQHIIRPKYTVNTSKTECESYTWPSNGLTYTASGIYYDSLLSIYGCDSVRKLFLTINQKSFSTATVSVCENTYVWPLNGQTYNQSGTYTDTIVNSAGCDSIATLNLTVSSLNTTVQNTAGVLSATQATAVYQWINCASMSPISGAVNQNFVPTSNGNYAVIIQFENCTDTSACVEYASAGIEQQEGCEFMVFPNPSLGEIQLSFPRPFSGLIRFTDLHGKLLYSQVSEAQSLIKINTRTFEAGIVLLNLSNDTMNSTKRLVIL
jgi:hypothetical protein